MPKTGEGNGNPLQYSCLENPMDGAWWAAVHGVAKSQTRLRDFTFTFHFHALEKEMATHSSVLAWRIPGMEEPGGLPSLGSHSWTRLKRLSSSSSSSSMPKMWISPWNNHNNLEICLPVLNILHIGINFRKCHTHNHFTIYTQRRCELWGPVTHGFCFWY